ncbi:MAG: NAD(P)H-dependent amine dehydrogenase family protein [Candidatus Cyclobacteriaceae bacterium M2_1C_046]
MKDKIKVVQIGLGPLGVKIFQFIKQRHIIEVVGAVDKNPDLVGKDLGEYSGENANGIIIRQSLNEVLKETTAEVAILTTVSSMEKITPQVEEIVKQGLHVVSTCEELSYPWLTSPALSTKIDELAKKNEVTVLGTGVNPGFLMDSLPSFLTSVCQDVKHIQINRYQDAAFRRIPFQKKIGAGLTLEEFDEKKKEGTLRHVGLTESMQFIAAKMGWTLENTEDIINPVVAEKDIETSDLKITKGNARGVRQIGNGYINGEKKIELIFQAAVGEPESYDEVIIKGTPDIQSKITGGVNGDVATCAITLNAVRSVVEAKPGLQTMGTVPLVTFFS